MNNEIQPFEFEGNKVRALIVEFEGNKVRALADGDEVMFVASDIAKILGYRDAEKLTRTLDDEEKGTRRIGTPGGTQTITVISEPGLYKAILQRQTGRMEGGITREFVKRFQRWVTHEVLPRIRRTGGYIPTSESDSGEDIMARAVLVAQKTIERKNQQLQAKDAQIKVLEPKARFADAVAASDGTCLVGELAKMLRQNGMDIGQNRLFRLLQATGISASPAPIATCRHSVRWTSACSVSRRPPSPMRMVIPRSVVLRRSPARGSATSSTGTGVARSRPWKRVRDE